MKCDKCGAVMMATGGIINGNTNFKCGCGHKVINITPRDEVDRGWVEIDESKYVPDGFAPIGKIGDKIQSPFKDKVFMDMEFRMGVNPFKMDHDELIKQLKDFYEKEKMVSDHDGSKKGWEHGRDNLHQ